jgi:hypothetical protein
VIQPHLRIVGLDDDAVAEKGSHQDQQADTKDHPCRNPQHLAECEGVASGPGAFVLMVTRIVQLPAALYAPLRVVLFEDEQGRGVFEYDKPSSFFGQFGDERVNEVRRYLDATLQAVLLDAAE